MDNVTHALAGALLAAATVSLVERRTDRPATPGFGRAAMILGVVAAELPDADLLYAGPVLGMGKLGYLLHHRGHTHTIVFAVAAALLLWGAALLLRRRDARPAAERRGLLGLALAGTLSHIALDYTNSYGVHPFWPVDDRWFYGDAVFIVEPWLWIAAVPPLIAIVRSPIARVLLGGALVGILAAAWSFGQVSRGLAVLLTLGAALSLVVTYLAPPARRVAIAMTAWLAFEAGSFAASRAARGQVRTVVGADALRDAVLTPTVANPLCFRALVVETDAATYRVTAASVAPFPALRAVDACPAPDGDGGDGTRPSPRPATRAVRWGTEWSAPRAELAALARANCEIASALRFVRVPAWARMPDGAVRLSDLRYGNGDAGFAELYAAADPARCPDPRAVPSWVPPRSDVLGMG